MTEGFALQPGSAAPRPRGRPKGSKNKRPGDLVGYLDVKCGGTAALQLAQGCMVTTAEVKAAGSLQAAELVKARRMVEAFDREAQRIEGDMRSLVTAVLADLLEQVERTEKAERVASLVDQALDRLTVPGGRLTLLQALDRMGEDRRALLPYTDQKQAQRVELKDDRAPTVMIFETRSSEPPKAQQIQGPVIEGVALVSPPKSHDDE